MVFWCTDFYEVSFFIHLWGTMSRYHFAKSLDFRCNSLYFSKGFLSIFYIYLCSSSRADLPNLHECLSHNPNAIFYLTIDLDWLKKKSQTKIKKKYKMRKRQCLVLKLSRLQFACTVCLLNDKRVQMMKLCGILVEFFVLILPQILTERI